MSKVKKDEYYEVMLTISKVRFDRDCKIITDYVDEVTLDLCQDKAMILSTIVFLQEGICRIADIYHSELSNSDPTEHSDLDTLDSLVRSIKTLAARHGLPID